jgi:hypothetical protein
MTVFELFEPLMWMAACWGCGILTGLGLGTAFASQRMATFVHAEWCDDDDA